MTAAIVPVRVKICGVRSTDAALAAVDAGADLLGFNFAPVSKRRVELRAARAAIDAVRTQAAGTSRLTPSPDCHAERSEASLPLARGRWEGDLILRSAQDDRRGQGPPPSAAEYPALSELSGDRSGYAPGEGEFGPACPAIAGIFVNQPLDEVERVSAEAALDFVQLSGDESPDYCREVVARSGRPVIKAVRLTSRGPTFDVEAYTAEGAAAVLLADSAVAGSWGGSGMAWHWGAAGALAARRRLLLAGGLTPDNVLNALAAVRPWGVDVASGVETDGVTDPAKVRAFVERAKRR